MASSSHDWRNDGTPLATPGWAPQMHMIPPGYNMVPIMPLVNVVPLGPGQRPPPPTPGFAPHSWLGAPPPMGFAPPGGYLHPPAGYLPPAISPQEENRLNNLRVSAEYVLSGLLQERRRRISTEPLLLRDAMRRVCAKAKGRYTTSEDISHAIARVGGPLVWVQQMRWVRTSYNDLIHEYMVSLASSDAGNGEKTEDAEDAKEVQEPDKGVGQLNPLAKEFCQAADVQPESSQEAEAREEKPAKAHLPLGQEQVQLRGAAMHVLSGQADASMHLSSLISVLYSRSAVYEELIKQSGGAKTWFSEQSDTFVVDFDCAPGHETVSLRTRPKKKKRATPDFMNDDEPPPPDAAPAVAVTAAAAATEAADEWDWEAVADREAAEEREEAVVAEASAAAEQEAAETEAADELDRQVVADREAAEEREAAAIVAEASAAAERTLAERASDRDAADELDRQVVADREAAKEREAAAIVAEASAAAERTLAERAVAEAEAGVSEEAEAGASEEAEKLQLLDGLPLSGRGTRAYSAHDAAALRQEMRLRAEAQGLVLHPSQGPPAAPTATPKRRYAAEREQRFERSIIRQHGQAAVMTQWEYERRKEEARQHSRTAVMAQWEYERRMEEAAGIAPGTTEWPWPPPATAPPTSEEAAAAPPPAPAPPPVVFTTRYARLLTSQEPAPGEIVKLTLRRATAESRWGVRLAGATRPRVVLVDRAALAWQQGVRVGDVLLTINGEGCTAGHAATTNMLRGGGLALRLEISRRQHRLAAETVQRYLRGAAARRALMRHVEGAANDADAEAVRAAQERAFAAAVAGAAQAQAQTQAQARSTTEQTLAEAMAEAEREAGTAQAEAVQAVGGAVTAAAQAAAAAQAMVDLVEEEMLCCPITTQEMVDPVLTMDGQTYERAAILAWLAKSATSPMTGEPLQSTRLVPNVAIKTQCALRRADREAEAAARATAAVQAAATAAASAGRGGAGRGGRGAGRGGRGVPRTDCGEGLDAAQASQHV